MNRVNEINWRFVPFSALTSLELYEMLQLRSEVFVVEQSCPFQDMDGADQKAMHLMGVKDGKLVAYARCFAAGEKFAEASIGRVVTHMSARGDGIGHVLMKEAITSLVRHWGTQSIRIGAQARLEKFYNQHGFVQNGEPYIEDGIPHIEMLRVA